MSRERAACVEPLGTLLYTKAGKPFAQFTIGPKKRAGAILEHVQGETAALKKKEAIGMLVERLRDAGHTRILRNIIREAASADAERFERVGELVTRIIAGKEPGLTGAAAVPREGVTIAKLGELWTSGELARRFPDHVRAKKTAAEDVERFKYLNAIRMPDGGTFGDLLVADVTLDDCDHVMTALPERSRSSWARRHWAQTVRRLLALSVYPLRIRESIPTPAGWLPAGRSSRAKAWIYPAEDLALMQCRGVPIARRALFGFLAREGMRVSEALGLTWSDVDLVRGTVRLDVNKTDDPRSWALGTDVVRALAAWKKIRGKKIEKVPAIFPKALLGDRGDLAHHLREGLKLAMGDDVRDELVVPKKERILLRAHDLRGSFVTLALACGKTEAWVTDRTGHKSSEMIYTYKRASRTAAELNLGWFEPLDEAIPELTGERHDDAGGSANGAQTSVPRRRETSRAIQKRRATSASRLLGNDERASGAVGQRFESSVARPAEISLESEISSARKDGRKTEICAPFALPDGDPLERALLLAAEAGRFDVVAQLADELHARRLVVSGIATVARRRSTNG